VPPDDLHYFKKHLTTSVGMAYYVPTGIGMPVNNTLGDQELALLRYVSEASPVTAGEVYAGYGDPNGLARSTIETVLERLRKKGFVKRSQSEGAYRYEPTTPQTELMGGVVDRFVRNTLGGSLDPLVTYFAQQERLSDAEITELERLVKKLEGRS
jgi:predicted transcriptional regulator